MQPPRSVWYQSCTVCVMSMMRVSIHGLRTFMKSPRIFGPEAHFTISTHVGSDRWHRELQRTGICRLHKSRSEQSVLEYRAKKWRLEMTTASFLQARTLSKLDSRRPRQIARSK